MTYIALDKVYGEYAQYVYDDSATAIEGLPESAWDAIVMACKDILCAGCEPGIDCSVTKTHETIANFDKSRAEYWSEQGSRSVHDVLGLTAIFYQNAQLRHGQQRFEQVLIDLGDCRVILMVG